MPTLLRTLAAGLVVLAALFTIGGLADDAPGLVAIAGGVLGVAVYGFLGARREEARRLQLEETLRRIADGVRSRPTASSEVQSTRKFPNRQTSSSS
jgi:hypothetical protein